MSHADHMLSTGPGQDAASPADDMLRRYLGADLADRLLGGGARDHDRFAAVGSPGTELEFAL